MTLKRTTAFVILMSGVALAEDLSPAEDPQELVGILCEAPKMADYQGAMVKLGTLLQSDNDEDITLVQESLTQRLAATEDPRVLKKIAQTLRHNPSDAALAALAQKHEAAQSSQMRIDTCRAISLVCDRSRSQNIEVVDSVIKAMTSTIKRPHEPHDVVDAAVMAVASQGSRGFDALVALRADPQGRRVANLFYTALGDTGDPRAFAVLREAIDSDEIPTGKKIQATGAIGQLLHRVKQSATPVAFEELQRCEQTLRDTLAQTDDGQLRSATLRTLGRLDHVRNDPTFIMDIKASLYAGDPEYCAAGMAVLFEHQIALDDSTRERLTFLAEYDPSEVNRSDARALLGAQGEPPPPQE